MPTANRTLTIPFSPLDDHTYRVQIAGTTRGDFVASLSAVIIRGIVPVNRNEIPDAYPR